MGYQVNSAGDSRGDEHLFMERFNANRQAIEAYKRTRGGDLEGAYQAVTGEPWPAGRSVKISNGQPEMTKDRSVKSVLGKYVAPIGGGVLTALTLGGAAPALAGLFGGGGGGGALAGGGGVVGGGVGTGALAAGATIPGAGIVSGVGGGGLLSTLGNVATWGQRAGDLGDMFTQGAGANAAGRRADSVADAHAADANNRARLDTGEFNMGAPFTRAQQVARGDMMASPYTPVTRSGSGRDLTFTGGLTTPFTEDTAKAGEEMKKQALLALMNKSDQIEPQITQPRKAGAGENILAGAGTAFNLLGALGRGFGRR